MEKVIAMISVRIWIQNVVLLSCVCEFGFVADRKAWDEQRIIPGFAVKFKSRLPGSRAGKMNRRK